MEVDSYAPVTQGLDHAHEGKDHPVPVHRSTIQEGTAGEPNGYLRLQNLKTAPDIA